MQLEQLQNHMEYLAHLERDGSPIVSCYIDLTSPKVERRAYLSQRTETILNTWPLATERGSLSDALSSVLQHADDSGRQGDKGGAIFARGGGNSFCLPLQFRFRLPTSLTVDRVPHLFNLVVSKDQYHRFVILLATGRSARIIEVSLGTVTQQITVQEPEEKVRVCREWTRLHYQNHRKEKDRQYIKDKISALERLMSDSNHSHLILAGEPRYTNEVRNALPKHLSIRLADVVTLSNSTSNDSLLAETVQAFLKVEGLESQDTVERLMSAYYRDELALLGATETLNAMLRGQVDTLVIARDHDLGIVHICGLCKWLSLADPAPVVCGVCGSDFLLKYDTREELVRLAEKYRCGIETVASSEPLRRAGGVGCLLRYARK